MSQFPPRIHVLLATRAPLGVLIRRGPSKRVCTVLWDRRRDDFRVGQWFKGRIYERRSDLSPDGQYMIYFAMNGRWHEPAQGSWTAISRAPYLKAIALFPKGDCWHGGGLFTGDRTYWLNHGSGHAVLRDTTEVRRDTRYQPSVNYGWDFLYYQRLLRDGWNLVRKNKSFDFEKPASGGWVIRKLAEGDFDAHELIRTATQARIACPDWAWADFLDDRLVWAANGKLMSGRLGTEGLTGRSELFDLNEMTFEPIKAPY
jgi:hypothetical protein